MLWFFHKKREKRERDGEKESKKLRTGGRRNLQELAEMERNRSEKEVGYSEKFRQKHVQKTNLRAEFMQEIATFKKEN